MSKETLDRLIKQADDLTAEEQLRLAAHLVEKARMRQPETPRRKWRELRGLARPSLLREDAQAWVSCL